MGPDRADRGASLDCFMALLEYPVAGAGPRRGLRQNLRVLRTIGGIEFKMKYADSAMGYIWSVAKPLAYFGVLYLVFGHLLKTGHRTHSFGLFLIIGILLYSFVIDAVSTMVPSIVTRGPILRRISFQPLLIPLSVTVTSLITLCVNMTVLIAFIGFNKVVPHPSWFLVIPLFVELYLFTLGLGLLLSSLYVRFRDIGQLWELVASLLIFVTPVMYPPGILPETLQKLAFLNPMMQVMQDVRNEILGSTGPLDVTAANVYGGTSLGRLVPFAIAIGVFALGVFVFRRRAPYFAELV
jgi:ABC-2 type transport system permease protein